MTQQRTHCKFELQFDLKSLLVRHDDQPFSARAFMVGNFCRKFPSQTRGPASAVVLPKDKSTHQLGNSRSFVSSYQLSSPLLAVPSYQLAPLSSQCPHTNLAPLSPQIRTRADRHFIQHTPNLWGQGLGVRGASPTRLKLHWGSFPRTKSARSHPKFCEP